MAVELFKEILMKNFPKLTTDIRSQIEEALQTLRYIFKIYIFTVGIFGLTFENLRKGKISKLAEKDEIQYIVKEKRYIISQRETE